MSTPSSSVDFSRTEHTDTSHMNKKRSSRACDQCRRTKSKCKKPADPNQPCTNCVVAGLPCTFQGPSYKRGPPKGYIGAIEQRLHQVEAILGSIVSSKDARSQGIIANLKLDDVAKEIIKRVELGPYGSSGRTDTNSPRQLDFSSTFDKHESRASRDSRISRETVSSSQDAVPAPTPEWLRKLTDILEGRLANVSQGSPFDSPPTKGTISLDTSSELDEDVSEKIEEEEAIGNLSVDENNEIRYHDASSGMPLLDKLTNNPAARNVGGIWNLPMARIWPYAPMHLAGPNIKEDNIPVQMPSTEHQDRLIELYFIYVHPELPVLHKPTFMALYLASKSPRLSVNPTPRLSKLLLLSMFTVASRLNTDERPLPEAGQMWEAGCDYLASARCILNAQFLHSSLPTCQALVILAYREFGLGSLEQCFLYLGLAIRMAQDLGLHRAADRWQRFGVDIFSPDQKQERKHVWWSCVIADKYISYTLGCPITIPERNYDTEPPQDRTSESPFQMMAEEIEVWQPHPTVCQAKPPPPMLSHTLSSFKASASLSIILGRIVEKIYSVRQKPWAKRHLLLFQLDTNLRDWVSSLPTHLHYDLSTKRPVPPHILVLHVQHSAAVILLHRKFIPHVDKENTASTHGIDTAKEFEICQSAAENITEIVSVLRYMFSLRATSAFLPSYLLSAGIVHIAGLAMNRNTGRAFDALQNTLACLKDMEHIWPSAARNWELLNGARMKFEERTISIVRSPTSYVPRRENPRSYNAEPDKYANTRLMAHLLGLEFPGVESSSTPSIAWPRAPTGYVDQTAGPDEAGGTAFTQPDAYPNSSSVQSNSLSQAGALAPGSYQWMQNLPDSSHAFQGFDFQSFTNPDPQY
ncbi:fungal-specific transcription factor domain-containing protein [Phellopilus nigrolimitatus]|nr:fungal-specific transcription factor domain-containing protein [Phellopilus nigrolimitatus]